MFTVQCAWYRVNRTRMDRRIRHITLLVLASYLFVGFAAHCQAFSYIFGLESDPQTIAESRPSFPVGTKVAWVQQKHIPVVTKISFSLPVLVTSLDYPRPQQYGVLFVSSSTNNEQQLDLSPQSPRGPPHTSPIL